MHRPTLMVLALLPGCTEATAPAELEPATVVPALAATTVEVDPTTDSNAPAATASLDDHTRGALEGWFERVGARRDGESFGQLLVRTARTQLGKPYLDPPQTAGPEDLAIELDTFQCVSFVEQSLALARCTWTEQQTPECFAGEVEASRYRDGRMGGYESRLHYFTDWIDDNARRERLDPLTEELGGKPSPMQYDFMTKRPKKYPALADPKVRDAIAATERRLSDDPLPVIDRNGVTEAQRGLQTGDLIAFVGNKAGIRVTHAGFVDKAVDGTPRVLHASSHHERVLLTKRGVAGYVLGWPDRQGILVARPVAPAD